MQQQRALAQEQPAAATAPTNEQQQTAAAAAAMKQQQSLPWRCPRGGPTSVRLAVVGDAHGYWLLQDDGAALQWLQADMVCVVGDLTNEGPDFVQQIAALARPPKAVILGNHDAWYTGREVYNKVFRPPPPPGDHPPASLADALRHLPGGGAGGGGGGGSNGGGGGEAAAEELARRQPELAAALAALPNGARNGVVRQLEMLGPAHVGYAGLQVPGKRVSIVGARPFTQGGKCSKLTGITSILWPGVDSCKASALRIQRAALAQVQEQGSEALVIMGHNAPLGLGSAQHDVAGVDWLGSAGDHGDEDLRLALDRLHEELGRRAAEGQPSARVSLVLCGHMHHKLRDGSMRRMAHVDADTGCVTLNAAVVPRASRADRSPGGGPASNRHYLLVELQDGVVAHAQHVWVRVASRHPQQQQQAPGGDLSQDFECSLHRQEDLLAGEPGEAGTNYRVWDAQFATWREVFVPRVPQGQPAAL